MQSADIKSLTEAYQSIYVEDVELTEDLLDETFDELVDELIEEGYDEDQAISLLEDATDAYLKEAKVTFGSDTTPMRKTGAPVGARRKYGMRKAGEAIGKAKDAVKGAADSAKKKASAAKAGAQIAGSIAKDEARRAGRKAALAVTRAPGKAKAAVDRKKTETKKGIKGFIKRQAEKVVKRMSEGNSEFPLRDAMRDAGMNNAPYRPKPNPASAPVKKAQKKPMPQMAGYELEGDQLVEKPIVLLPGTRGYVATGPLNKNDKKVSGLGPIGTYSAAKPVSGGGKKTTATMSMQNNSNELEGDQLVEKLKATGLFSEQEIAKIAEQATTVTTVPPAGNTFRTGSNSAPKPPTLPKPTVKKKPEPKLGAGVPGFQYGGATGP